MSKDTGNGKSSYLHQFRVEFSVSCVLGIKKSSKWEGGSGHEHSMWKRNKSSQLRQEEKLQRGENTVCIHTKHQSHSELNKIILSSNPSGTWAKRVKGREHISVVIQEVLESFLTRWVGISELDTLL